MLGRSDESHILQEQLDYYRARAAEYDQWFFRTGRYDRGEEHRAGWEREIAQIEAALTDVLPAGGRILELACGTGLWTRHLTQRGADVVAVDAAPEVLAINKNRLQGQSVEYVQADLFSWTPPRAQFDLVFFGFWLSHVPDANWSGTRSHLEARRSFSTASSIRHPQPSTTRRSTTPASRWAT
jgi:2-polyprenyl-3-methyl-5-hydroxy-6-metoxy-1,4-benzoquinol methylase